MRLARDSAALSTGRGVIVGVGGRVTLRANARTPWATVPGHLSAPPLPFGRTHGHRHPAESGQDDDEC